MGGNRYFHHIEINKHRTYCLESSYPSEACPFPPSSLERLALDLDPFK